jgi:RNA polymerase sigma-70 factor (ECF subfamily)
MSQPFRELSVIYSNSIKFDDMISIPITQGHVKSMDLNEQLNQFFISHEKKAYSIALMSLRHQDDALDVVQDVMIKFVEKYKNKRTDLWAPLFYRMIHNRITDTHRTNTKIKKFFVFFDKSECDIVENVEDTSVLAIIDQIDNAMKIDSLQEALTSLPSRQLQAFICRIWEGLSVAQTAQSMKCSQGSVKTHLFRALKNIRNQIKSNHEVNNHG